MLYSIIDLQVITVMEPKNCHMSVQVAMVQVITPHACARGKAIGLYVCCCRCPHENHQFGCSRPLSDL